MLLIPVKSSNFEGHLSFIYRNFTSELNYHQLILLLLINSLTYSAFAQQHNNWYFGRKAGITFNPIPDQQIPSLLVNSEMLSDEAAASISDEKGKLLFYTNGTTVFNKNHQVMLNGDNLAGNISATQMAIVPMPGNDSLYYIFTTGAIETNFSSGYRYSIVDIKRDNGRGEIISKNNLLWPSCSERLTTSRHANGIDVWLITNDNNSNIFRAWLITCTGIQPAIVSTTGVVMDQHNSTNAGELKVSPNGRWLCQTHFPYFDEILNIPNFVQLFDFNNINGTISNARTIGFSDAQFTHCEFSPDSRLLYLTRPSNNKIDQLDITAPTLAGILASRTSITTKNKYHDIQLAPDQKIYLATPIFEIGVINQPNTPGPGCNFSEPAISLLPGSCYLGLPSLINDFVFYNDPNNGFIYNIIDSCSGIIQFQAHTMMPGTINWYWDFGDGTTSVLQNPIHTFSPANENYNIQLKITSTLTCGTIFRSKILNPQGILTGNVNFDFFINCDSGYVRFTNTSEVQNLSGIRYEWDFGDGTISTALHPVHSYSIPGNYLVKLKMFSGLTCLDTFFQKNVNYRINPINAPPDQTITIGQSVFLAATGPAGTYKWVPSTWLNNPDLKNPVSTPLDDIVYTVTVTNSEACPGKDSIKIFVKQYNDIYVPSGFTPGNDGKNDLLRPFYPESVLLKEFSIYNRWGQLLFTTSIRNNGWDGKVKGVLQGEGAYVWILKAEDKSGKQIFKKGSFVLIR